MKRTALFGLLAASVVAGCSSEGGPAPSGSGTAMGSARPTMAATSTAAATATAMPTAAATATATAAPAGNRLADPKGSIEYQLELLKAGKTDELKECFTERQKSKVTPDSVKEGQKLVEKMTLDELVGGGITEAADKKTAKIKMKAGNPLTTLILTDGKWLADTIWFK